MLYIRLMLKLGGIRNCTGGSYLNDLHTVVIKDLKRPDFGAQWSTGSMTNPQLSLMSMLAVLSTHYATTNDGRKAVPIAVHLGVFEGDLDGSSYKHWALELSNTPGRSQLNSESHPYREGSAACDRQPNDCSP